MVLHVTEICSADAQADAPEFAGMIRMHNGSYKLHAVPPVLVGVLQGGSISRLLHMYRVWDSDRSGTISVAEFHGALKMMGVSHTIDDVKSLFSVLGAHPSCNGKEVTFEDLMRIKGELDERAAHAQGHATGKIMQRIAFVEDTSPLVRLERFLGTQVLMPLLGTFWKSELRPHHTLEMQGVDSWRRAAQATAHVQAELHTWHLDTSEHGEVRIKLYLTPIRGPSRPHRL